MYKIKHKNTKLHHLYSKDKRKHKIIKVNTNNKLRKRIKKSIFVSFILFSLLFIGISISLIVTSILIYLQFRETKIPTPDKVFPTIPLASYIYDRNGVELYRLLNDSSNNDRVNISEITNTVRASFIISEDSNFYVHQGFDPIGIIRCSLDSLTQYQCGGSTITQQLIKLTTKQNKQTLERKIDEILLSIKVEQSSTKDQILEMYLRVTPYGSNITGIEAASKFYFGITDLKNLTLAQAITLALIVNDPVHLSPTLSSDDKKTQELLTSKREYLLNELLKKLGYINEQLKTNDKNLKEPDPITKEMIEKAKSEQIVYIKPVKSDIKAGHFVEYVIDKLQKTNYKNNEPFTLSDLETGGYRIYTTLDYNLEKIAEDEVNKAGNQNKRWNVYNAAVMTISPSSGEVITMAGSKSFNAPSEGCDNQGKNCKFDPQVNVLTSPESPGSTNKPIGYYEAFKESKLFPGSFLPDIPIQIGNYTPKDWDGSYMGLRNSAGEMLRQSRNIPALEVIQSIGVESYLNTARSFGYTTYTDYSQYGPSIILGGGDVLPVEHTQAYGVFANGGDLVELNPILKIYDQTEKKIYTATPQKKNVADPKAVWLLNQSLFKLNSLGTNISWDDRDIAGKTGTTQDNKDALVMMYSPDFVTLGWVGNNNNSSMDQNYGYPVYVVMPWLKDYMQKIGNASYFSNKTRFNKPSNVYQGGGNCNLSNGLCLGITSGWLISGREPRSGDVSIKKNDKGFYFSYTMPAASLQYSLDKYIASHGNY